MADEALREGEERWEREDAILVVELVLVVGDLRLVLQLALLEGQDGEDEEDTEEAAEEVDEADTEEEDEAREVEDAEEAEQEPREEEEKPEEEEEVEGPEEAEQEEGEEQAEVQAVVEEAEVEEAKEEHVGEEVAEAEEAGECEEPEEGEEAQEAEEEAEHEDQREEGQKEEEGAQELQEKQKGEEQPEGRRGPIPFPLEALEALQSELEPENKQASRSSSRLRLSYCRRRQRHLEHRSALIRGIPGFWAKAFVNHPQMSAVISKEDEGLLGYMTDLKVEDLRFPRDCRQILLFFRKNPYFRNEVVVKEYVLSAAGYGPSHSTPIQWHQDYEQEAYSRRDHNTSLNFFNWFSDPSFASSSRIAEIIMDDLWPNPLQYYMR
ncbi:testis-specific Y-encoded protein 3-like [Zalophus californianus]|uniref:Testis-specific Y-encoded protein 3-like n=1 Tax=Zalophus californianus TaxID=9704 RepID=A0A6P9F3W8_ZALCA|nr:testis-specific Y-encoded protein 3-like [Zalophus californianus]